MQTQYEAAWTNAESTHAQGRQLLDSLTKVGACVRLLACSDLCWCYPLHFVLMLFYMWLLRSGRPRLFARLKEGYTLSLADPRGADYSSRCIPPSDTGSNASCS